MEKNIALILPCLGGGGAERVASELSQFYAREGHHVYIFTMKKYSGYARSYQFDGIIISLGIPKKNYTKAKELYEIYYLSKEIKKQKKKYCIDVSISFMEQCNMANILSKGKEKVIVGVHTILSARSDLKGLYMNRFLINRLYNKTDYVVVLSQYGKMDMIKNYGIKESKLTIIPNAVIPRNFDNSIPWKYGNKVILSVNRIHPIKQQGIMIDTIAEIIQFLPEVKLLIVGNDKSDYAKKLKKLVVKRGLENNVIFVGPVDNVEYYMKHSQVFLLTSAVEGFSIVIIEAMNQGLPVISTDFIGPVREILGVSSQLGYGKYGLVAPRIDEKKKDDEYCRGIQRLSGMILEILTNPELEKQYAFRSRMRAENYSKEKIESLWREII